MRISDDLLTAPRTDEGIGLIEYLRETPIQLMARQRSDETEVRLSVVFTPKNHTDLAVIVVAFKEALLESARDADMIG